MVGFINAGSYRGVLPVTVVEQRDSLLRDRLKMTYATD